MKLKMKSKNAVWETNPESCVEAARTAGQSTADLSALRSPCQFPPSPPRRTVHLMVCVLALLWMVLCCPAVCHAAGTAPPSLDGDAILTRGDGVELLYNAAGRPASGGTVFFDVPADAPFAQAVSWAAGQGIAGGYRNGAFGPGDTLSRQQYLTMLYRLARSRGFGYHGPWAFTPAGADYGQTAAYAREAVCWIAMLGILPDGPIRPVEPLTRAQGEEMTARLYAFLRDDMVYTCQGVYLGLEGYGTVTKEQRDEFRYRFFVDGAEVRYGCDNGPPGEDGTNRYALQNRLEEGGLYQFRVRYGKIVELEPLDCRSGTLDAVGQDSVTLDGVPLPLAADARFWVITTSAGGASVTAVRADGAFETSDSGAVASIQAWIGGGAWAALDGDRIREVYLAPLTLPYTPPVTGTPGLYTLKNFLAVSLTPVGTTLYHYGGGWNWQDDGASVQTASIGLPAAWVRFFQSQDAGYTYKDPDGSESHRDPAHSYYPFGKLNQYYYAGADCSGYVGWALYNTMNTQDGGQAIVGSGMVRQLAEQGWGSLSQTRVSGTNPLQPGDIVSISGHIYIVLGSCPDGSVVILHSTPSDSRTGQPGGGVQIGA
ncbi:MAG: S-layer homology domain-containing protein, partial [Oscillibacter sp.]|nr:S-layer homology domain-containing protein [Oscillibacter sp.]